jgi:hypothetical protein
MGGAPLMPGVRLLSLEFDAMTEPSRMNVADERLPEREMSPTRKFFIFLGVVGGAVILIAGWVIFSLMNMQSEKVISGGVTLTPEWAEVTLSKALSFPRQSQVILLDVNEPLVKDNLHLERMQLADGTFIHPQLQVIDKGGNASDIELYRAATSPPHENSIGGFVPQPPEGRVYVKVRVRCDRPLHISKIVWSSWDGK